jgi:hypothetical protein
MSDSRHRDETLLIDLLLGQLDDREAAELRSRLRREGDLRAAHENLRRTFAAMDLAIECEPPADLVSGTMARVRAAKATDALLAREDLGRRDVIRPTFSLRELTAVAASVLIITGVFGIFVRQAQRQRELDVCKARMGRIGSSMLTYAGSNGERLPAVGAQDRRWMASSSQPAVSNSMAMFRLVKEGYESPVTFQCPAVGHGSFVVKKQMNDFPAARFVSYSYQHSLGAQGMWINDPRLGGQGKQMVVLADANPVFRDGRFQRERARTAISDNHSREGMNVLFLSGGVEFKDHAFVGVDDDNIYLAKGVEDYRGDEAPSGPTDSFLLPAFSGGDVWNPQD